MHEEAERRFGFSRISIVWIVSVISFVSSSLVMKVEAMEDGIEGSV